MIIICFHEFFRPWFLKFSGPLCYVESVLIYTVPHSLEIRGLYLMKLPQTKSFKFCNNILCKYKIWQIVFDWNFLSSTNHKIGRSGICIEWLLLSDFNIIVKGHCCFMYYRPWERKKVQGQRHIHQFLCKRALLMLLERFEALHRRIKSWEKILLFF